MREIKFRGWDKEAKAWRGLWIFRGGHSEEFRTRENEPDILDLTNSWHNCELMQFTGLLDKNGEGLIEVYESDIIRSSELIGNIYEDETRENDFIIPRLGTKAWESAYPQAVERGFDYSE